MKLYAEYDYESLFDQILRAEHEEALKLESILRGSKKSRMVTKTVKHGSQLDCEIYPAYFSCHDLPRIRTRERSKETMRNLNDKNAKKMVMRLININFTQDDLWICLDYDDFNLPESEERAQKDIRNYFRRLKYLRKKQSLPPLRYIYVTEYSNGDGKPTRVHHHAIISGDMDRDTVENAWDKCERKYSRRLKPDDYGLKGMAKYITKTRQNPDGSYSKRWGASKGLKQPNPTKSYSRLSQKKIRQMVTDYNRQKDILEQAYPGYIFQHAEIRTNDINGGIYIYAQLRRVPPETAGRRRCMRN